MKYKIKQLLTKKNIIILISGILIGVIVVGLLLSVLVKDIFNFNSNSNLEKANNSTEELNTTTQPVITTTPSPSSSPKSGTSENTSTPSTTVNEEVTTSITEEELVNYFQTESNSIDSYNNETNSTFREKAKTIFTNTVDFIFYDKEIKGYTFDELTLTAKLKIIKIGITIDNKIDSYFPNYKDTIKESYNNIKSKLVVLYLSTTSKICETVGTTACTQAREDFKSMKSSFSFSLELITSAASNTTEIIKEWYESIK